MRLWRFANPRLWTRGGQCSPRRKSYCLGVMYARVRNLILCRWGWSFCVISFTADKQHVVSGREVYITANINNNGLRIGTCYVTCCLADSYQTHVPFFESNTHLSLGERESHRLIDIAVGKSRATTFRYAVPKDARPRPVDFRIQIWNPHHLFAGPYPFRFFDTGWKGAFTVVDSAALSSNLRVFLSYSWSPEADKAWVQQLAEALRRRDINVVMDHTHLKPGDETTYFMESHISSCDVTLLICTESYTTKANERRPGGVGFESIIGSAEYMNSVPSDRARFIPVVRNNSLPSGRKLPKYLGSSLYADLSGDDWSAEPLERLVEAIRRHPPRA